MEKYVEDFYAEKIGLNELVKLIEGELAGSGLLNESVLNETERFSYSIAIPKLVPTEAWGDPSAQDRAEINRVFSVIRGGANMKARIGDLNKFLDPAGAALRRSPSVILKMMMIVEALQAALNDYNESAAGFVFEGFMAALTGGKQIAGRVRGTLPIEDFVAFSEIGQDDPVSLKLLGPDTDTKGSFTNLVDYLFARGAEKITYLVVFKLTVGSKVEKLQFFDYVIDRNNLVDVMLQSKNMGVLGSTAAAENLKIAIENWDEQQGEGLREIALALNDMPGYTNKGMMYNMGRGGEAFEAPEDAPDLNTLPPAARKQAERIQKLKSDAERIRKEKLGGWEKLTRYVPDPTDKKQISALRKQAQQEIDDIERQLNDLGASMKESLFHEREKLMMESEDRLIMEAGKSDGKSQWAISRAQMDDMSDIINMRNYGIMDLSQKNIDTLIKIYSEKLGAALQALLENTKELTENIGRYYSESRRKRAMKANTAGQAMGETIVDLLQKDPKYSDEES
jgi:hypothetical protein